MNGDWKDCPIHALKKGDKFRAFEPDGKPMKARWQGLEHITTFQATSDAECVEMSNGKKEWGVKMKPVEKTV